MAEKAGPPRPYGSAIASLLRVLLRHWPHPPLAARRAALWLIFALILGALGVNKQLDLQTLLTDIARLIARYQGWYNQRQLVQVAFLFILASAGLVTALILYRIARGQLRDFRVALLGITLLIVFVFARAASFHHIDHLIGKELIGVRVNGLLELPGIILVGAAAFLRRRAARK